MSCVTHSARCKGVDIPLTPLSCSHSALSLSVCAMLDNCHVIISNKRQISWQTFPYAIEGSHKGMGGVEGVEGVEGVTKNHLHATANSFAYVLVSAPNLLPLFDG